VARFFSLRRSACHTAAFASLTKLGFDSTTFVVVLGACVEDAFDTEEEFCEVGSGPFGEAANKRLNHVSSAFIS
jgi:hypothetical protein